MAIIAMTTRSSIRVKASVFILLTPGNSIRVNNLFGFIKESFLEIYFAGDNDIFWGRIFIINDAINSLSCFFPKIEKRNFNG